VIKRAINMVNLQAPVTSSLESGPTAFRIGQIQTKWTRRIVKLEDAATRSQRYRISKIWTLSC